MLFGVRYVYFSMQDFYDLHLILCALDYNIPTGQNSRFRTLKNNQEYLNMFLAMQSKAQKKANPEFCEFILNL